MPGDVFTGKMFHEARSAEAPAKVRGCRECGDSQSEDYGHADPGGYMGQVKQYEQEEVRDQRYGCVNDVLRLESFEHYRPVNRFLDRVDNRCHNPALQSKERSDHGCHDDEEDTGAKPPCRSF